MYLLDLLFYILRDADAVDPGGCRIPFFVSWSDAAEAFRLALDVELDQLPPRCEILFIHGDLPHNKFLGNKAERILGFRPKDAVAGFWQCPDP